MSHASNEFTDLLLIRHGPTLWNGEKRLQGHTDIPISSESETWIKEWQIPSENFPALSQSKIITSPLQRAKRTAELMFNAPIETHSALIEMHFGDWEGHILPQLRQELGEEMRQNEAQGLDFTPPNGETPRQVIKRLQPFFIKLAQDKTPIIAFTHLAVIRAVMAWACDWPMVGKPPYKLEHAQAHHFRLSKDGIPTVQQMNIKLHHGVDPNKNASL